MVEQKNQNLEILLSKFDGTKKENSKKDLSTLDKSRISFSLEFQEKLKLIKYLYGFSEDEIKILSERFQKDARTFNDFFKVVIVEKMKEKLNL